VGVAVSLSLRLFDLVVFDKTLISLAEGDTAYTVACASNLRFLDVESMLVLCWPLVHYLWDNWIHEFIDSNVTIWSQGLSRYRPSINWVCCKNVWKETYKLLMHKRSVENSLSFSSNSQSSNLRSRPTQSIIHVPLLASVCISQKHFTYRSV